jgi:hypothetical protein
MSTIRMPVVWIKNPATGPNDPDRIQVAELDIAALKAAMFPPEKCVTSQDAKPRAPVNALVGKVWMGAKYGDDTVWGAGDTLESARLDLVKNLRDAELFEHDDPVNDWRELNDAAKPDADEAAVDQLRCWSVGYEYYYDAYFGPDAPFGNQQPTAATLAEVLQAGARLVPQAMRAKDDQIAALRRELKRQPDPWILAKERDKAQAELAELRKYQAESVTINARLKADLAAATERAEKAEAALLERDRKITERDDWFDKVCRRLCEAAGADVATLWSDDLSIEEMEAAIRSEVSTASDAARADADALAELAREATEALIRATNNLDPECLFCRFDATPEGDQHAPDCIIERLRVALAAHDAARKGA